MSKIKVDTVTNVAGTGAPNIPDGITVGGVALASINVQEHYAQSAAPSSPKDGAVWYDTDDDKAYVYINSDFYELDYTNIPSSVGERGLFGGNSTESNVIQYITISTPGNSTDFGDLTVARRGLAACSSGTRGVFAGGYSPGFPPTIDYVTIATTGNATDFGDLISATYQSQAGAANITRGLFAGGNATVIGLTDAIDYITIATPSNGTDFGNLTVARQELAGAANLTRALFASGTAISNIGDIIDYVTIATTGNATDFGNLLSTASSATAGCASLSRALFGGGVYQNIIQYVTISTPGNATDFGDLSISKYLVRASSNGSRGVFGGGNDDNGNKVDTIEYVTIATTGNATDFGDLLATTSSHAACSGD